MKQYKVSEVAKVFGLSTTAIYKHLKRFQTHLNGEVSKDAGATLVSEKGIEILREHLSASVVQSREMTPAKDDRIDGIEKSMLLLVEKMTALVTENAALRSEVSAMRQVLEYKPVSPAITEKKPQPVRTPAPIRAVSLPPAQREMSMFESITSAFDDVLGFAFGRG